MGRKEIFSQKVPDLLQDLRQESAEEKRAFLRMRFKKAVEEKDPWGIFEVVCNYGPLDKEGESTKEMISEGTFLLKQIASGYSDRSIWENVSGTERRAETPPFLKLFDLAVDYLSLPRWLLGRDYWTSYNYNPIYKLNEVGKLAYGALESILGIKVSPESLPFFGAEYYQRILWNQRRLGLIVEGLPSSNFKDSILEKTESYVKEFKFSSRQQLQINSIGENPLTLSRVAAGYLFLGEERDREEAWIVADLTLKILEKVDRQSLTQSEFIGVAYWILTVCSHFDYSGKGDFVLLSRAQRVFEEMLASLPVNLDDALETRFRQGKEGLSAVLDSLRCDKKVSRRAKEVLVVELKSLDKVLSGTFRVTEKMAHPQQTTLFERVTGRLTRKMDGGEEEKKIKASLKEGSVLQFTDGSSAKVLQVFSGGETTVCKVENNVGRICAMRVYHGENKGKDFELERGRFVNALRSQVSKQARECIPEVYDYKVARDGITYVAQEFIEGENLEAVSKPTLEDKIRETAISLASTLSEIHQNSIAHLDIKPSNLIMTEDGKVVIIDWDLAKNFGENYPQKGKDKKGTVAYASQEICIGIGKVDGSADIYSFGVTLYELFTGKTQVVGIVGSSKQPLFKASFEQRFPKIDEVPEKWRGIIENCTYLDSHKRPTAKRLLQMLQTK